jgi:hypothetical protein
VAPVVAGTEADAVVPRQTRTGVVRVADGAVRTVTKAAPLDVPAQSESVTTRTVYVVLTAGATVRVAGLEAIPFCSYPSDQTRFHGPEPLRLAEMTVESPRQRDEDPVDPVTKAVGALPPHTKVKASAATTAPPSGFTTFRSPGPAAWGPVTMVMLVGVTPEAVTAVPSIRTWAPGWKPVPVIVTGVPPREGPVAGETEAMETGRDGRILTTKESDQPPP